MLTCDAAASSPSTTSYALVPSRLDLGVYRGDTFVVTLLLSRPDGTAVDLTGAVVSAHVSDLAGAALIAAFAVVVTPPGTVALSLSPVVTVTLPRHTSWDLEVVWPDTSVQTVAAGQFETRG